MESLEAAGIYLDEDLGMEMDEDYLAEDDFMDEDYLEEGGWEDDDLGDPGMELEEEELVNEVTRRVGRRLAKRRRRKR